jgi:hypothetical protein
MNWLLSKISVRMSHTEFLFYIGLLSTLVGLAITAFIMQLYYTYAK